MTTLTFTNAHIEDKYPGLDNLILWFLEDLRPEFKYTAIFQCNYINASLFNLFLVFSNLIETVTELILNCTETRLDNFADHYQFTNVKGLINLLLACTYLLLNPLSNNNDNWFRATIFSSAVIFSEIKNLK